MIMSDRKVAADPLADQAAAVGVLADPVRRALYRYVAGQAGPVSREDAAAAVGVPVHSAKFHLDRLQEAGLLDAEYQRLSGRTGPGAGRPAKVYRRSERQVAVSLPQRRYDLAGEVLAEAVDRSVSDGTPVAEALRAAATEVGRRVAEEEVPAEGGDRVGAVLARCGYEPRTVGAELCLVNCPFDRLAAAHTELVCGMNLDLVAGVLDALGATVRAELRPTPGWCCVRVV
jgi:predicted ArsR family transcriptional regulator